MNEKGRNLLILWKEVGEICNTHHLLRKMDALHKIILLILQKRWRNLQKRTHTHGLEITHTITFGGLFFFYLISSNYYSFYVIHISNQKCGNKFEFKKIKSVWLVFLTLIQMPRRPTVMKYLNLFKFSAWCDLQLRWRLLTYSWLCQDLCHWFHEMKVCLWVAVLRLRIPASTAILCPVGARNHINRWIEQILLRGWRLRGSAVQRRSCSFMRRIKNTHARLICGIVCPILRYDSSD